jgi:hypothetical protein
MKKSETINYRDFEITYSVFGKNKHYSALAKVMLRHNNAEIIKLVRLNSEHDTVLRAEEKILQKTFEMIRKQFYKKNFLTFDNLDK